MIDLLVVGGGPAGLCTALLAHRQGLVVEVVEKRSGDIDKACGEGLMPGAVSALRDLGVVLDGRPFHGIRYLDGRYTVDAPFRRGHGLGVRRTVLHAALRKAVAEAGIAVHEQDVGAVTQDPIAVRAAGHAARYLAAADGLHSPVRRALRLDRATTVRPRWGQRRHFRTAPWTDRVEVHWSRDAEAYVTPVADDQVGVAVLSGIRRGYGEHLAAFPALAARLRSVEAGPVLGAGPLRQAATRRRAGRVLLVGDASGYVDALTGEGIAVAVAQARELVRCVAADRPADYEAAWIAVTRRYRWLTGALLTAAGRPATRRLVVPLAAGVPPLFRAAVGQLAR